MRSTRNGLVALSAAGAIVLSCAATSPAATTPAATASAVLITKQPVAVGTGGAVASDDVEATSAGLDVLRHGGNAIDAAVAVAATLGVADPFVAGIIDPATGKPLAFPVAVTSGLSVGVPGTLMTWQRALDLWGTQSLAQGSASRRASRVRGLPGRRDLP